MAENSTNEPLSFPPPVDNSSPEDGSEPVEEPDQQRQDMQMRHLLRDEKIRCVMIGIALFAIILSGVLFLLTKSIVPLFGTIVGIPLLYRCVDVYLDRLETSAH